MARGPQLTLDITQMSLGNRPLFQGFQLQVQPGETLALIGPSGVGKTTLLRILAGVETGFVGRALIDGVPATEAPVPGLVFQDARLLPWLNCGGNLAAVCPGATRAQIETAMVAVGLGGLAGAWPRQLSGGMQRRLGLARALLVNPGLLLLDEPFVSLDRAVVRDLQTLVANLIVHSGATTVLVSHDPGDAARLATRAVLVTGRPVRILADLPLDRAPAARSRSDCSQLEDLIETHMSEQAP